MNGPWSEAGKKWAKILYKSQQMLEKQKQMNIQIRNKVNVEVEEVLWKKCNKCLLATTQCSAINTTQGRNVFISRLSERQGIVFSIQSLWGTLHLWIMNWKLERRFFSRYHLSCNFHSFSMAIFSLFTIVFVQYMRKSMLQQSNDLFTFPLSSVLKTFLMSPLFRARNTHKPFLLLKW